MEHLQHACPASQWHHTRWHQRSSLWGRCMDASARSLLETQTGHTCPALPLPLTPCLLHLGVLTCCRVLTTGMFTLAQSCMSGMCSVAQALYPSIPLKGASYEDIAVSLIKALQSGTDQPSTWTRPGRVVACWLAGFRVFV